MRFLVALLLVFVLNVRATPLVIHFNLASQFNASPASNRVVTLQPQTPFVGNILYLTSSVPAGECWFTNTLTGPCDYVGEIKARGTAFAIPFMISIGQTAIDAGGTVEASTITSIGNVQSYPTAGRSAYTIQAMDAKLAAISTSGGGTVSPGDGTATVATNSGNYAVKVTPGVTLQNTATNATGITGAAQQTVSNIVSQVAVTNGIGTFRVGATGGAGVNVVSLGGGAIGVSNSLNNVPGDIYAGNIIAVSSFVTAAAFYGDGANVTSVKAASVAAAVTNKWQADATAAALLATNNLPTLTASNGVRLTLAGQTLFVEATNATWAALTAGTNSAVVFAQNAVANVVTNGTVPTFAQLTAGTNSAIGYATLTTNLSTGSGALVRASGAVFDGARMTNYSIANTNFYVDPVKGIDAGNTGRGITHPYRTVGVAAGVLYDAYGITGETATIFVLPGLCIETNFQNAGVNSSQIYIAPGSSLVGSGREVSSITNKVTLYLLGDGVIKDLTLYGSIEGGADSAHQLIDNVHIISQDDGIAFPVTSFVSTFPPPYYANVKNCLIESKGRGIEYEDGIGYNPAFGTNGTSEISDTVVIVNSPTTNRLAYAISQEQISSGYLTIRNCRLEVSGAKTNMCIHVGSTNCFFLVDSHDFKCTNSFVGYTTNISDLRNEFFGALNGTDMGAQTNKLVWFYNGTPSQDKVFGGSGSNYYSLSYLGDFTGNGGGLTNLPAAQLTGTVPAASLPSNLVTNNGAQTFTAWQTFSALTTNANVSYFSGTISGTNSSPLLITPNAAAAAEQITATGIIFANGYRIANGKTLDISDGSAYETGLKLISKGNLRVGDTNIIVSGAVISTNGFASYSSNKLALTSITVTGSPFSWTNTQPNNVVTFINGGTASAIAVNGTTVFTLSNVTLPLQPGEWFTITYTVAPTAVWKPL